MVPDSEQIYYVNVLFFKQLYLRSHIKAKYYKSTITIKMKIKC